MEYRVWSMRGGITNLFMRDLDRKRIQRLNEIKMM